MTMQLVLPKFLLEHAPLAAIVGDHGAYWDEIPQGEPLPAIVMFLISGPRDHTYQGQMQLQRDRVQFDCRSTTADGARLLAEALHARLQWRGAYEGVNFQGAFQRGHRTRSDKDGAIGGFTAIVDYIIWSAPA